MPPYAEWPITSAPECERDGHVARWTKDKRSGEMGRATYLGKGWQARKVRRSRHMDGEPIKTMLAFLRSLVNRTTVKPRHLDEYRKDGKEEPTRSTMLHPDIHPKSDVDEQT